MKEKEWNYDWESDLVINGQVETLRRCPKPVAQALNFSVFTNMIAAKIGLDILRRECGDEGVVKIEFSPNYSSGSVSVEMDSLEVYKPKLFAEVIEHADNFEFYPLVSGKIKLALIFYNALIPVAWNKKTVHE